METARDITPYLFEGEHLIRTVEQDGEACFVGMDVCKVLGIRDHKQALERLDGDERGWCIVPPQQGEDQARGMIVVSEAGVYRLVFTSRKPVAERFKRWLAHDVIPSIRRTGGYGLQSAPPGPPANEHRSFPEWPMDEMRTKLKCVDGYRMLYGIMAAQWISPQLGFPSPPPEIVERGRQFVLTLVPNEPEPV